jgi:microcystin-dependent protein
MDYYLGQIGTFGFNFAPINWALCNGATLSIAQNTALFSLIGTTYGGNGQTTFELPNLQSRTPLGIGSQTSIGETAGVENVTLLITELPAHNHQVQVNNGLAPGVQIQNSVFAGAKGGGVAVSGMRLLHQIQRLTHKPSATRAAVYPTPISSLIWRSIFASRPTEFIRREISLLQNHLDLGRRDRP